VSDARICQIRMETTPTVHHSAAYPTGRREARSAAASVETEAPVPE